jgi:hypothetical protein
MGTCSCGANRGKVVLRWFSDSGDVLVWESAPNSIAYSSCPYWQPITARIPVWPRGATSLRFEVVSDSDDRVSLATGFVFMEHETTNGHSRESHELLALCRTKAVGTGLEAMAKPLAELLSSAPKMNIDFIQDVGQRWVAVDVSKLDYVGMSCGNEGQPKLVIASGNRHGGLGPLAVALPLSVVLDPETELFAGDSRAEGGPLFKIVPRFIEAQSRDGSTATT